MTRPLEIMPGPVSAQGNSLQGVPEHPARRSRLAVPGALSIAAVPSPCVIGYVAMETDASSIEADREHLGWLCYSVGAPPPDSNALVHEVDIRGIRLRWERQPEVATYIVTRPGMMEDAFTANALAALPADWVAGLPGRLLVGLSILIEESSGPERSPAALTRLFGSDAWHGITLGGGLGLLWSDWRPGEDGLIRLLIRNLRLNDRELGRMVARFCQIESGRMRILARSQYLQQAEAPLIALERKIRDLLAAGASAADPEDDLARADIFAGLSRDLEKLADRLPDAAANEADLLRCAEAIDGIREGRIEGLPLLVESVLPDCRRAANLGNQIFVRLNQARSILAQMAQGAQTRATLMVAEQNRDLVAIQGRMLQRQAVGHTVIVLAAMPMSAYALVGLADILGKALSAAGLPVDGSLIAASMLPFALLGALWFGRLMLSRLARR